MPNFNRILYPLKNKWFCSYYEGSIIIGKIITHEPNFIQTKNPDYAEIFSMKNVHGIFNGKFVNNETIKDASFFIKQHEDIIEKPRENINHILLKKVLHVQVV